MNQQERVVNGTAQVWGSIDSLLRTLDKKQWDTQALPLWTVGDVVGHIVGTEKLLLGEPAPDVELPADAELPASTGATARDQVYVDSAKWLISLRASPMSDVIDTFTNVTTARNNQLASLAEHDWATKTFEPIRQFTYEQVLFIRVLDCWIHEQDIRDAVGIPGNEHGLGADITLDTIAFMLAGTIDRCGLESGWRLRFDLMNGDNVHRTVDVEIGESARVVRSHDEPPTATLTMPPGIFVRLFAQRVDLDAVMDQIAMSGDVEAGATVLANLGSM